MYIPHGASNPTPCSRVDCLPLQWTSHGPCFCWLWSNLTLVLPLGASLSALDRSGWTTCMYRDLLTGQKLQDHEKPTAEIALGPNPGRWDPEQDPGLGLIWSSNSLIQCMFWVPALLQSWGRSWLRYNLTSRWRGKRIVPDVVKVLTTCWLTVTHVESPWYCTYHFTRVFPHLKIIRIPQAEIPSPEFRPLTGQSAPHSTGSLWAFFLSLHWLQPHYTYYRACSLRFLCLVHLSFYLEYTTSPIHYLVNS